MDQFKLLPLVERDLPECIRLMELVKQKLLRKDFFVTDGASEAWFLDQLRKGSFGVKACDETGKIIGFLFLYVPGAAKDNLGRDFGWDQSRLAQVCHAEYALVHPDCRGHGLQYRMLRYALDSKELSTYQYLFATVSPENTASLKSLLKAGFTIQATKIKYGGYLRHIMLYTADRDKERKAL